MYLTTNVTLWVYKLKKDKSKAEQKNSFQHDQAACHHHQIIKYVVVGQGQIFEWCFIEARHLTK